MKTRLPRKRYVHFYWSAWEVLRVEFVRWCLMRMETGDADTNKLGVGAIVRSNWCLDRVLMKKIPHGLRRGMYRLRPYTDLYRTCQDARRREHAIRRPSLATVKSRTSEVCNDR